MFDELVLQDDTKKQLEGILQSPRQSYMFVGPSSVGKFTSALHVSAEIINADGRDEKEHIKAGRHPDIFRVEREDDKKSISIEQIHDLQHVLKLKPEPDQIRVIIIREADLMSLSAQNALLKLFEEVPENALIFLTTSNQQKIITTIHSRATHIRFYNPNKEKVQHLIENLNKDVRELVETFGVRSPGILHRLTNDSDYLEQWKSTYSLAAKLINGDSFQRLALVNKVADDNDVTKEILAALKTHYRNKLLYSNNDEVGKTNMTTLESIKAIKAAQRHLASNVNHKLTISDLMLKL